MRTIVHDLAVPDARDTHLIIFDEQAQELTNYASAMHSLFSPSKPETAERVLEALRPISTLRELVNRSGGGSSSEGFDEQLEDFVELDLPTQTVLDAEEGEAADTQASK